jgi:prolyl-tRNA synthetase
MLVPWDGSTEEEEALAKRLRITIRCLPFDEAGGSPRSWPEAPCILTGRPTKRRALWARSY